LIPLAVDVLVAAVVLLSGLASLFLAPAPAREGGEKLGVCKKSEVGAGEERGESLNPPSKREDWEDSSLSPRLRPPSVRPLERGDSSPGLPPLMVAAEADMDGKRLAKLAAREWIRGLVKSAEKPRVVRCLPP
jgi:hypothetical protein